MVAFQKDFSFTLQNAQGVDAVFHFGDIVRHGREVNPEKMLAEVVIRFSQVSLGGLGGLQDFIGFGKCLTKAVAAKTREQEKNGELHEKFLQSK
jgi:hypothetical protein